MDIRKVKKLIELIEESDIGEIEIHEGEESVRISRTSSTAPAIAYAAPAPMAAPAPTQAPAAAVTSQPEKAEPTGHQILSPMVGTFYRASSPTSKAFVEEGHFSSSNRERASQ